MVLWQRLLSLLSYSVYMQKAHSVHSEYSELRSRQLSCDLQIQKRQRSGTCAPL